MRLGSIQSRLFILTRLALMPLLSHVHAVLPHVQSRVTALQLQVEIDPLHSICFRRWQALRCCIAASGLPPGRLSCLIQDADIPCYNPSRSYRQKRCKSSGFPWACTRWCHTVLRRRLFWSQASCCRSHSHCFAFCNRAIFTGGWWLDNRGQSRANGAEISWQSFPRIRDLSNFRNANHSTKSSATNKIKWDVKVIRQIII